MNPYDYATFLDAMFARPERLIGPREELEQILVRVSDERPAPVFLIGPWGVGKSFLLQLLAHNREVRDHFSQLLGSTFAATPERLLFVLVPLAEPDGRPVPEPRLFGALWDGLLSALSARNVADSPFNAVAAGYLARLSQQHVRAVGEAPPAGYARASGSGSPAVRRHEESDAAQTALLLELVAALDEAGLRAVFLIDDFDTVAPALSGADYERLAILAQHAALVMASSKPLRRLIPSDQPASPLSRLAHQVYKSRGVVTMFFLAQSDALRLVEEPPSWHEATADFRFSRDDALYIIDLVGLHHDFIRLSCQYLFHWYRRYGSDDGPNRIPVAARPGVRVSLRLELHASFNLLWHKLDPEEQLVMAAMAADDGPEVEQQATDGGPFARLIEMNYIVFRDGRLRIFADLFEEYVRGRAAELAPPASELDLLRRLDLTMLERRLLEILGAVLGEVVLRERIFGRVYSGESETPETRGRLEVLVSRLRTKLKPQGYEIESVRGKGYRLFETHPTRPRG